MAEELVDAARLQAGYELALRPSLTDVRALVQQVVDEQTAATNGQHIELDAEPGELWVVCDGARIARVIGNVLSNAVKYSPPDGPIEVALRHDGEWVVLCVADEGIGIPAEDLPHVFERFHRAHNVSGKAGTGLGLPGVRSLVEQHGGTVAIESTPGRGTRVTIRLPRRVAERPQTPALPLAS
jgi:two-component system sensor histidine kinase BaeS